MQFNLYSQKEFNNWCFPDRNYITFNTPDGEPVNVVNNKNYARFYYENACVSDYYGNLLFTTNNLVVLDKNLDSMENGQLIPNFYRFSYLHYIVQLPKHKDIYYLFYSYPFITTNSNYAVIDMSANKGLGKVIKKSFLDYFWYFDFVKHSNGKDVWIICIDKDSSLTSVLMTEKGISKNRVNSNLKLMDDWSYHYISPNGETLAGINYDSHDKNAIPILRMYSFDKTTGILKLQDEMKLNQLQGYKPGTEAFSSDGKMMYIMFQKYPAPFDKNNYYYLSHTRMVQLEINNNKILDTVEVLNDTMSYLRGIMRLAPNNKIYLTHTLHPNDTSSSHLSVINNPSEKGKKCNLELYKMKLLGQNYGSLPIWPIVNRDKININSEDVCEGATIQLNAELVDTNLHETYEWFGPNGFHSTERTPKILNAQLNMTGYYRCVCKGDLYYEDSTFVQVNPNPIVNIKPGKDIYLCDGNSEIIKITSPLPDQKYRWSTGDTTSSISVSKTGQYIVYTETLFGCSRIDTINVTLVSKHTASIIAPNRICEGSTVSLSALPNESFYNYRWSTGDTTQSINVSEEGKYSVIVSLTGNCADTAGISISYFPKPKVKIQVDGYLYLCRIDSTILTAIPEDKRNYSYNWNTGDTTSTLIARFPGEYKVVITDSCGYKDSTKIIIQGVDFLPLITQESKLCKGGVVTLSAYPIYQGLKYLWSTGDTTQSISINKSGKYKVLMTYYGRCADSIEINVDELPSPKVKILGNNQLCNVESTSLSVDNDFLRYLWNNGQITKSITVSAPGKYSVTVTDTNGCTNSDTIEIVKREINIGLDKSIDFGKICIGSIIAKELLIENLNPEIARIKSINLKNQSKSFLIGNFNQDIQINGKQTINLTFEPKEILRYNDTLFVEFSEPCTKTYSIPLSGISSAQVRVWFPDTSAEIADRFSIPLYSKLICGSEIKEKSSGNFSFDQSLLYPDTKQNSGMKIIGIENNYLKGEIEDYSTQKNGVTNKLNSIKGIILLADQISTELKIDNFIFNNDLIEVEKQNGSLTINKVCANNLRKIQLFEKSYILITPNPASDYIEISLSPAGGGRGWTLPTEVISSEAKNLVRIYNALGENTTPSNLLGLPPLLAKEGMIKIDISNLSPGVYFIKIGDKFEKFVKI